MDGEIIKICKDGKYEFMTSMDEQNHGTALKVSSKERKFSSLESQK